MTSLGEYRVGITFNPSGDSRVNEIKKLAAEFIDLCRHLEDPDANPEVRRLWALASTHAEDAAMWAVKAVTKVPRGETVTTAAGRTTAHVPPQQEQRF